MLEASGERLSVQLRTSACSGIVRQPRFAGVRLRGVGESVARRALAAARFSVRSPLSARCPPASSRCARTNQWNCSSISVCSISTSWVTGSIFSVASIASRCDVITPT